ncbi:MAG: 2-ketoisovalerate ferredoxin oxidoreductase, partial [Sulfurovum sp.]|nr:2-ketoisovalerate ferredoxin oxidoreductase [Sulfurovum sp.]MCB4778078.1 2-ketoisovalerate ferredoxin oxidoreductase [Sulfurovum sp.]
EISAALYTTPKRPLVTNYIYGLGGRDFAVQDAIDIYHDQKANADVGHITTDIQQFSGLRGPKLGFFQTKRS